VAFWEKKGVDPWDIDPEKQKKERERAARKAERENEPGLLEELKTWNEERKAKQAEEDAVPPQVCPWCGGEMTGGYLSTGRDRTVWSEERPGIFLGTMMMDTVEVCGGAWAEEKTAWLCKTCRKLVVDIPAFELEGSSRTWKEGWTTEPQEDDGEKAYEAYQEQVKEYQ